MKKQKRYNYNHGGFHISKTVAENERLSAIIDAGISVKSGLDLSAKGVIQAANNARLEAELTKNLTSGDKTSRIGLSAQQQLGPVKLEGDAFTGTGGTGTSLTASVNKGPFSASHTESRGTGGSGSNTSLNYFNNGVTATYDRNKQNGHVVNRIGAGWKGYQVGVDRSDAGTGAFASYNKTLRGGGNVNANLNKVPGAGLGGSVTFTKKLNQR